MPLNFPSNPNTNDAYTFGNSQWQYNGVTWNIVSSATTNAFATITVAGQSNIVADSVSDTLTFIAGSNVTLATNDSNDSITINSTASGGAASNSFATISVAGQNSVVADSSNDILTLVAGTNITITTDQSTDTVTINSTASAGATNLTNLTDVLTAGLTVDKIYLPAITRLNVTNNGASSYRFDQYGTSDNPTVYAINATTIAFNLNVSGHPFLIQNNAGVNYDTGLVHVTTAGVVTTGASAQGKTSGTLYWKIPDVVSGNYRYQCSAHAGMVGTITIKNFGSI